MADVPDDLIIKRFEVSVGGFATSIYEASSRQKALVGFDEFVKIGFTTNMRGRLQSLRTHAPARLTVYGTFIGSMRDERELHQEFSSFRLEGEWFRFSGEIKDWLDRGGRCAVG